MIDPKSFYGKLRALYSDKVIKTQLDQLKKSGAYKAFDLKWQPCYDVKRLYGAKARVSRQEQRIMLDADGAPA